MKKTIFILLMISMLFIDCSKEKCWDCVTTMTTTVNVPVEGYPQTTTVTNVVCDEDIEAYEKEGTFTVTATISGISATVKTVTKCKKQ